MRCWSRGDIFCLIVTAQSPVPLFLIGFALWLLGTITIPQVPRAYTTSQAKHCHVVLHLICLGDRTYNGPELLEALQVQGERWLIPCLRCPDACFMWWRSSAQREKRRFVIEKLTFIKSIKLGSQRTAKHSLQMLLLKSIHLFYKSYEVQKLSLLFLLPLLPTFLPPTASLPPYPSPTSLCQKINKRCLSNPKKTEALHFLKENTVFFFNIWTCSPCIVSTFNPLLVTLKMWCQWPVFPRPEEQSLQGVMDFAAEQLSSCNCWVQIGIFS